MTPFIEMLYEAADDPEVVSIRITLYRLAASSKLAAALAYAADQGKDVLCLLELRARFDEKNNIDYSEMLEDAGCSVIYGLQDEKVHSKLCLITRKCGDTVKYITQIGTGNYNEVTSEQYCDLSLITSDRQIGIDATAIFEALALGQAPEATEKLITSPLCFRPMLLAALDNEISKGSEGFVAIKVNSMNDVDVMAKLVECSRAGVPVEMFIRGICCLRPGLPGYSDNIRVRSVIGRYLEHSRVYVFGRGDEQRIFIGSGDLLNRNTQRRVEAFVEVTDPDIREQVLEVMEAGRQDDVKGWDMQPDGTYTKVPEPEGVASQERLYEYFSARKVEPLPVKKPRFSSLRRFFSRRGRNGHGS
jgi:polyphosphate kinase